MGEEILRLDGVYKYYTNWSMCRCSTSILSAAFARCKFVPSLSAHNQVPIEVISLQRLAPVEGMPGGVK
jgi:hypothetical protein